MNSTVYGKIGRVYFEKGNTGAGLNHLLGFEDLYDQIVISSNIQIDFVYRGWLGDITYWAADGVDINDYNKMDLISEPCCVKDALCVRVNVTYDRDAPVRWEYVFLKC